MRTSLAALTLAAALAAGGPALLDPLWALLTAVWSPSSPDAGCIMDPSGSCSLEPQTDEGCRMDPSG